jgi:putative FmdB family regulatory protein
MPLYEYRCLACGHLFELIQKFSDPAPASCTRCGQGPVERQLSSPAIQFKGSGWYITDYARKASSEDGSKKSDGAPAGDSKTEAATSDAPKPDGTKASGGKSEAPVAGSSASTASEAKS